MYDDTIAAIVGRIKRTVDRFFNAGISEVDELARETIDAVEGTLNVPEALAYEQSFIDDSNALISPDENAFAFKDAVGTSEYDAPVERLKQIADAGYEGNEGNCSGSVKPVLKEFGVTDLKGTANQMVQQMRVEWEEVTAEEAQKLANKGKLAIAGLENQKGSGHVMVVYPGNGATKGSGKPGDEKRFYPNVKGGGSQAGRSDGDRTAGDTWKTSDRAKVKYFIPKRKNSLTLDD